MTLASQSLEQTLFTHLSSDIQLVTLLGGNKFFYEPRRDQDLPYVTVNTVFSRDWSTGSEPGQEHRVGIHVWAGSQERALQQEILSRLRVILTDPAMVLTDHHLVNLTIERSEIRTDRKSRLLQGILQLRAVTEDLV